MGQTGVFDKDEIKSKSAKMMAWMLLPALQKTE